MRIPTGETDRYIYFVAVDATDLKTRETGLSSFTVYGSKNGAAAAPFTTPTINETDSSNMAGVYELLLDEQTTLTAGNDTEELCLHITHAGMAPVTRIVELYRPETTEGNTLTVESDGDCTKVNTCDTLTNKTGFTLAADQSGVTIGTVTLVTTCTTLTNKTGFSLAADQSSVTVGTVNTLTGHTAQTGDSYAVVTNATYGNSAIRTQGDAAWVTATSVTVSDKTGFSLSSAGVSAITTDILADTSWNAGTIALSDGIKIIAAAVAGDATLSGSTITYADIGDGGPTVFTSTVAASGTIRNVTIS